MTEQPANEIDRIANEYFSLLARAFPVMCASDEFHFLPRVQEAVQFLDRIDELSQDVLHLVLVQEGLSFFERIGLDCHWLSIAGCAIERSGDRAFKDHEGPGGDVAENGHPS